MTGMESDDLLRVFILEWAIHVGKPILLFLMWTGLLYICCYRLGGCSTGYIVSPVEHLHNLLSRVDFNAIL